MQEEDYSAEVSFSSAPPTGDSEHDDVEDFASAEEEDDVVPEEKVSLAQQLHSIDLLLKSLSQAEAVSDICLIDQLRIRRETVIKLQHQSLKQTKMDCFFKKKNSQDPSTPDAPSDATEPVAAANKMAASMQLLQLG